MLKIVYLYLTVKQVHYNNYHNMVNYWEQHEVQLPFDKK